MTGKPFIAIVPLGHYVYFEQFEGLYEELSAKAGRFRTYLDEEIAEVFVTDYVDTVEKAFATVRDLRARDVAGVFLLLTTYLPSAVAAPFAVYLDAPLALIGIQPLDHLDYGRCTTFMQLVNDDICAMPEIAGAFVRLGRAMPPCVVAASGQGEAIGREVLALERAMCARAAFRYATIGYLGHTYEGMYDMHTDPTAFTAAFGAHVKMLEMCELKQCVDTATDEAIGDKVAVIRSTFEVREPSADPLTDHVGDEDLHWAARTACALDELVRRNHLSALAYYYKGEGGNEYERIAASLIVGNTLLTSGGVPLAGEADLKTAAAMLIMSKIGGGGSFAELHPFDVEADAVLVGHDGPHNIAISEGTPILRKLKKYHGKAGSGIGVEFSIRAGDVTLLSMSVGADGKFRLVAAAGRSVRGEIPQTGNTNTRVAFDLPVTTFIRRWCEAGPTHHLALGCGNRLKEIEYFARFMSLPLTVVAGREAEGSSC